MTTTVNTETLPEVIPESPFLQELVQQIKAQDAFGIYRNWEDRLILAPLIITKKQKRTIPVDQEVNPATQLRIIAFYRAIAAGIEKATGQLCQVIVDLNHEGFGWCLVWCGKLMVVSRTLRDAQRFGFNSWEKLASTGEKLTQDGIELIQRFPEVAKL